MSWLVGSLVVTLLVTFFRIVRSFFLTLCISLCSCRFSSEMVVCAVRCSSSSSLVVENGDLVRVMVIWCWLESVIEMVFMLLILTWWLMRLVCRIVLVVDSLAFCLRLYVVSVCGELFLLSLFSWFVSVWMVSTVVVSTSCSSVLWLSAVMVRLFFLSWLVLWHRFLVCCVSRCVECW